MDRILKNKLIKSIYCVLIFWAIPVVIIGIAGVFPLGFLLTPFVIIIYPLFFFIPYKLVNPESTASKLIFTLFGLVLPILAAFSFFIYIISHIAPTLI